MQNCKDIICLKAHKTISKGSYVRASNHKIVYCVAKKSSWPIYKSTEAQAQSYFLLEGLEKKAAILRLEEIGTAFARPLRTCLLDSLVNIAAAAILHQHQQLQEYP